MRTRPRRLVLAGLIALVLGANLGLETRFPAALPLANGLMFGAVVAAGRLVSGRGSDTWLVVNELLGRATRGRRPNLDERLADVARSAEVTALWLVTGFTFVLLVALRVDPRLTRHMDDVLALWTMWLVYALTVTPLWLAPDPPRDDE